MLTCDFAERIVLSVYATRALALVLSATLTPSTVNADPRTTTRSAEASGEIAATTMASAALALDSAERVTAGLATVLTPCPLFPSVTWAELTSYHGRLDLRLMEAVAPTVVIILATSSSVLAAVLMVSVDRKWMHTVAQDGESLYSCIVDIDTDISDSQSAYGKCSNGTALVFTQDYGHF